MACLRWEARARAYRTVAGRKYSDAGSFSDDSGRGKVGQKYWTIQTVEHDRHGVVVNTLMGGTIMAKKKQTKWRYWVWSRMVVEAENRMRWAAETNWLGGALTDREEPSSTEDLELWASSR